MKWNLEELKNIVRTQHGDQVAESLLGPMQSIAWKINMRNYHACESVRLLKDALRECTGELMNDDENEAEAAVMAIVFWSAGDQRAKPLVRARYFAEAHMIAAAQALHSTADIMAHVVYWALGLPSAPRSLNIERLSLRQVRNHLTKLPQYRGVVNAIEGLLDSGQFKYLNAYVNTTKHRSLVTAAYTAHVDPLDNPRQGLRINAFRYEGCDYAERWGKQFLFADAKQIGNGIVAIGNALIAHYEPQKTVLQ